MGRIKNFLRPGQVVKFYSDFRNELDELGTGLLITKEEEVDTEQVFILKDEAVNLQKVYGHEKWLLQVVELTSLGKSFHYKTKDTITRPIRVLYSEGITRSGSYNREDKLKTSGITDTFISLPGIGQIF